MNISSEVKILWALGGLSALLFSFVAESSPHSRVYVNNSGVPSVVTRITSPNLANVQPPELPANITAPPTQITLPSPAPVANMSPAVGQDSEQSQEADPSTAPEASNPKQIDVPGSSDTANASGATNPSGGSVAQPVPIPVPAVPPTDPSNATASESSGTIPSAPQNGNAPIDSNPQPLVGPSTSPDPRVSPSDTQDATPH